MTDNAWMHIYGVVGVIALIAAIWPQISLRLVAWTTKRKAQKKKQLESEIQSIKLFETEDFRAQRMYRYFSAQGCAWLTAGLAIGFWSLLSTTDQSPLLRHGGLIFCSFCFGSSCGAFIGLAARMKKIASPEEAIATLEKRIRKLQF